MISVKQIKAARVLAEMKQSDLAAEAGISLTSLNNIERRVTKPRMDTLLSIRSVLEERGVEFLPQHGVCLREDRFEVKILEGIDGLHQWFDDIYMTVKKDRSDVCMIGVDEKKFLSRAADKLNSYLRKIQQIGVREKVILRDGDDEFIASEDVTEYRWVSESIFSQVPSVVYGDSYSIITWGDNSVGNPDRIIIIRSPVIAESARRQFMAIWNNEAKKPKVS